MIMMIDDDFDGDDDDGHGHDYDHDDDKDNGGDIPLDQVVFGGFGKRGEENEVVGPLDLILISYF